MNNKMLHRGSLARLPTFQTSISVLSTCILLLIQIQTSYALPTSSLLNSSGSHQQNTGPVIRAFLSSTAYASAYPYSSYRPGARLEDSYRPYSGYPKESIATSTSSPVLYVSEDLHPNSVYSRQSAEATSSFSQNLDKVLKLVEKEIPSTLTSKDDQDVTPAKQVSLPLTINNTPVRNNKPRLLPLPSVQSSPSRATVKTEDNNNKKEQQPQSTFTTSESRREEFSPVPPPFAPELDPEYERRQYGLGALSLLDQAGPFW